MVCTPAPLQTCPCQPLLHPAHSICSSSSFAKHWFLLKPPKTKRKRELQALSFAELCITRQHSQICCRNNKKGGKMGPAWASVHFCPPTSSCVHFKSGEAASLNLEHRRGCWLFFCIVNKTASTDTRGCCREAAGPGSGGRRL